MYKRKLLGIFCLALLAPIAMVCAMPLKYNLGKTPVSETDEKIVILTHQPISISILPGGRQWPLLTLDEAGNIYVGNVVIDGATGQAINDPKSTLVLPHDVSLKAGDGGFELRHAGKRCYFSLQLLGLDKHRSALMALSSANMVLVSAATGLLARVTQFGADGRVSNYRVEQLDLGRCGVSFHRDIGNPDLLVELGHSLEGGWWMTGSIEQTLLLSRDGHHWRKATLPAGISSLMSAYVANSKEIWLAAILHRDGMESPYLLVYSNDGGRSWRNVLANDPVLGRLPTGWLEGQKRRAQ